MYFIIILVSGSVISSHILGVGVGVGMGGCEERELIPQSGCSMFSMLAFKDLQCSTGLAELKARSIAQLYTGWVGVGADRETVQHFFPEALTVNSCGGCHHSRGIIHENKPSFQCTWNQ